jgi:hypothetical protein
MRPRLTSLVGIPAALSLVTARAPKRRKEHRKRGAERAHDDLPGQGAERTCLTGSSSRSRPSV